MLPLWAFNQLSIRGKDINRKWSRRLGNMLCNNKLRSICVISVSSYTCFCSKICMHVYMYVRVCKCRSMWHAVVVSPTCSPQVLWHGPTVRRACKAICELHFGKIVCILPTFERRNRALCEATRHCLHACGVASLMIARPTMLLCMQNKTIFELHFLNVECSFCIAQVSGLKNANCAFLQSENESTWSISMRNY